MKTWRLKNILKKAWSFLVYARSMYKMRVLRLMKLRRECFYMLYMRALNSVTLLRLFYYRQLQLPERRKISNVCMLWRRKNGRERKLSRSFKLRLICETCWWVSFLLFFSFYFLNMLLWFFSFLASCWKIYELLIAWYLRCRRSSSLLIRVRDCRSLNFLLFNCKGGKYEKIGETENEQEQMNDNWN